MARRVKYSDDVILNGFDGDDIKKYIDKIEDVFRDMDSEKGKYMERCKSYRGTIDMHLEEAKAKGIPKKALKAIIALRKLELQKRALTDAFEGNDKDEFDLVAEALGDFASLPLGAAAVASGRVSSDEEDQF